VDILEIDRILDYKVDLDLNPQDLVDEIIFDAQKYL
jgi:hypothetical protein